MDPVVLLPKIIYKEKLPFKVTFIFRFKTSPTKLILQCLKFGSHGWNMFHVWTSTKTSPELPLFKLNYVITLASLFSLLILTLETQILLIQWSIITSFFHTLAHSLRSTWLIVQLLFCTSSNHLEYLFL